MFMKSAVFWGITWRNAPEDRRFQGLVKMWQLKTAHVIPLVLSTTGIIQNTLHESLKLLNLRPAVYILTQNT
jgi:hypothetical protein